MSADAVGESGAVPRFGADELVAAVPGLAATGVRVVVQDVRQLPGASLRFDDVAALAHQVRRALDAGGMRGAVVTQGTDTIEETSWLLDLLSLGPAPVVVTGAMRHPGLAGADGPANLLAAIQVAASPLARDLGVLVVFGDEIHAARHVRKTHSTSPAAFCSPDAGPVGHLCEGVPRICSRPPRLDGPHRLALSARVGSGSGGLDVSSLDRFRVPVVPMTLGQDDAVLRAVGSVADGLVVAGFGVGHVPAAVLDVVTELAAAMPVVLASRAGAGPVASRTYAFPGSESDLLTRGLVRAGYLDPYKARVLLHLLLAEGASIDAIRQAFARHGGLVDAGPGHAET